MTYQPQRALDLLRIGTQRPDDQFREGQEDAIRKLVDAPSRLAVIQATGWGKSAVYFIATKLLREQGLGPTLLVSPLLSLMRNQMVAARRMGVVAESINSTNSDDWADVIQRVQADRVDLLLISPERLANESFRREVLDRIGGRVGMLVIDEAHCISDWGHDFRPDYQRIARIVKNLAPNARLLATTATANDRVVEDIKTVLQIGRENTIRGNLARPSLTLQTIRMPAPEMRLAWLAEQIKVVSGPDGKKSGIVYALTVENCERIAEWLRKEGIRAEAYHSGSEDREALEDALIENRITCLVATVALGMGFDKPDIAFVFHYNLPASVVAYYQQVGRAARAKDTQAYGVILGGDDDDRINEYFIRSAFPTEEEAEQILDTLDQSPDGLTAKDLATKLNMREAKVIQSLKVLALEEPSPVQALRTRYYRTPDPIPEKFWQRINKLSKVREEERVSMRTYLGLHDGHMAHLLAELNATDSHVRGGNLPPLPSQPSPDGVRRAGRFLDARVLNIAPRRIWPAVPMPSGATGYIPFSEQPETGRALSLWGEGPNGARIRQEVEAGQLSDATLDLAQAVIGAWLGTASKPKWVTIVPSLNATRAGMLTDFAEQLAHSLRIPFVEALGVKTRPPVRIPQSEVVNTNRLAINMDGAFKALDAATANKSPVLLIDDWVSSRWTMTFASATLRKAGVPKVYPFALAYRAAE